MRPPGRPEGSYRSVQHEGTPVSQPCQWQSSPFAEPNPASLDRTLIEVLSDLALTHREKTAVIHGARRFSFGELASRVGGLAQQILAANPPPGPVALIQSCGVAVVAAWFACSLAGRPLLLLEPQNPPERNRLLMTLAGATLLIHDDAVRDSLPTAMNGLLSMVPDSRLAPLVTGTELNTDAPAMIFPTSGSTGEPKLVVYAARTLLVKVQASIGLMGARSGDTVLIAGSHGNFGFLHHALVFLLAGGTLCLFDVRALGLAALFKTIRDHGVGHVRFTPSLFRTAARLEPNDGMRALRGVRFSGEPLLWNDVTLARQLLDPHCQIQNVYGSTESAIFIWTDDRTITDGRAVAPIGQVYPSFDFAIEADDDAEPPNGIREGRLFIRSRHQALGDWQEARVDGSRFPADPAVDGMRLYDTGDIVRQEPNGDLTMLGRADRIVKVNGYRVSLAEIEAHLLAMPGCAQAAVIERRGPSGTSLAAFVTGQPGTHGRFDGRRWLATRLPAPMVPAQVFELDALPLLPGGKLDYRRLSSDLDELIAVAAISPVDDLAAPPSTDLARLRALWNEVLQRPAGDDDDPDQDFSDLGGDSLQMLSLRVGFERLLGRPIDDQAFLKRPTLRRLAELAGIEGLAEPRHPTEDGVLSFRCVQPATGPSRGVALAMPGWGGGGMLDPWLTAGAFTGFDVWACRLSLASGNVMQAERWLQVAEEIAAAVARGACPAPKLVFGYSIAGYIGWLVDRLLSDSPLRPQAVICLDTLTMHRIKRFQSLRLRRLLTATAQSVPGRMLLIRRAPLSGLTSPSLEQICWAPADADLQTVLVRTLEHCDMESPAVLTAVNPAIRRFLEDRTPSGMVNEAPIAVDTYSGQLFELISEGTRAPQTQIDRILKERPKSGTNLSIFAVRYIAIAHGEIHAARALIEEMLELHPKSLKLKYALFGLSNSRRSRKLIPADPCYQPPIWSFRSIEKALALRSRQGAEIIGASNGRVRQFANRFREFRDFGLTLLWRPAKLLIAVLSIKVGR